MDIPEILLFTVLGLFAGVSGGLLGIGGGSITLPILYVLLKNTALFPQEHLMQVTIGTTFAAMALNALVSFITHHLLDNIRWPLFLTMLPWLIIGPIAGAVIAMHLHGDLLRYGFGLFQCLISIYFLISLRISSEKAHHYTLSPFVLNTALLIISTLGSILGIGGGVLLMPFLIFFNMPFRFAIGTSSAATFVMISLAALSYFVIGSLHSEQHGFIYLPAFLAVGLSSVAGAPIGAYLVQFIPVTPLKKIFAVAQAALGIFLIIS